MRATARVMHRRPPANQELFVLISLLIPQPAMAVVDLPLKAWKKSHV
jgi:hypothetical protein